MLGEPENHFSLHPRSAEYRRAREKQVLISSLSVRKGVECKLNGCGAFCNENLCKAELGHIEPYLFGWMKATAAACRSTLRSCGAPGLWRRTTAISRTARFIPMGPAALSGGKVRRSLRRNHRGWSRSRADVWPGWCSLRHLHRSVLDRRRRGRWGRLSIRHRFPRHHQRHDHHTPFPPPERA